MGKAEEFFKKIAGAKDGGKGGAFIEHGNYEQLKTGRIELRESENPETKGKLFFVVEFEIGTFTGGKYTDAAGKTVDTTGLYTKGQNVSDSINLEDAYGNGLPRAKALAAAILASKHNQPFDTTLDAIDEEDIKALCGPDQPGKDALLKCSAVHIITKKTKKDFTVRNYLPQNEVAAKAA